MRLAIALTLLTMACGPKGVRTPAISPMALTPIPIEHTIRVIGNYGLASACAVNRYVVTAGHVVSPFLGIPGLFEVKVNYAWESYGGLKGYFVGAGISQFRDVGLFYPGDGDVPHTLPLSTSAPESGDTLRWLEYDRGDEDFFAPAEASGTVIRTLAGHIMVDTLPTSGSSGVCVFNDNAEVVGIISWGVNQTNVVIDLTGQWWLE